MYLGCLVLHAILYMFFFSIGCNKVTIISLSSAAVYLDLTGQVCFCFFTNELNVRAKGGYFTVIKI